MTERAIEKKKESGNDMIRWGVPESSERIPDVDDTIRHSTNQKSVGDVGVERGRPFQSVEPAHQTMSTHDDAHVMPSTVIMVLAHKDRSRVQYRC